jgi:hypothetical protein
VREIVGIFINTKRLKGSEKFMNLDLKSEIK